jgi:hypothetical protein
MPKPQVLYFLIGNGFNRHVEKVTLRKDGFYYDSKGTIWALRIDGTLRDPDPRCGVGLLSLPKSWLITRACKPHDYKFDSEVYQTFHTFEEANRDLERDSQILGYPLFGRVAKWLSSTWLGKLKWEGKK